MAGDINSLNLLVSFIHVMLSSYNSSFERRVDLDGLASERCHLIRILPVSRSPLMGNLTNRLAANLMCI